MKNKLLVILVFGIILFSLSVVSAEKTWSFHNHSLNVSNDIELAGNLTLGQKITFAFAETIDNIVNGWIRITGNLQVDGDVNITGGLNLTGDLFVGGFNVTGDFVPYTGATSNLVLGANNFSVNTNTLFVDSDNGNVGIGTTSPLWKLDISNSTQGIIMSPNKGSQNNPIINTTGSTNLTITSSGGSVIIRLG